MSYNSALYLFMFLPLVLLMYQIVPRRIRPLVLLAAGYTFFYMISGKLLVYLIGTTIFVHYIGIWLGYLKKQCQTELLNASKGESSKIKKLYKKREKHVLIIGILAVLAVLVYLKYYNFFAGNINILIKNMGGHYAFTIRRVLLPIGISFYTLQAISYMADVYWEKIKPEENILKLALFLGFFPQIMEGPISMYSQTSDDLWAGESLKMDNLAQGGIRLVWGLFKKMIIADRLFMLVTALFDHYEKYSGALIIVAAIAYTTQLYMEFSGCMDIIIGSGKMFGVTLPENFNQPFASKNAAEFWRRWHMTLGVWFKTYVFYPVSVSGVVKKWNKFSKKHFSKYITKLGVSAICLFPVWLFNGLWHGSEWNYIFYGIYYFTILLMGIAIEPVRDYIIKKLHLNVNALYYKVPQTLKAWVIIFTGELFFRANGLRAGFHMFASIFKNFNIQNIWNGTLLKFGLDRADFAAIIFGCIVVAVVGYIKERNLLGEGGLWKMRLSVRWAVYYGLILSVIFLGAYGVGYQQVDLIYAGF